MCKLANTDKISVFAHLSKLLVNDSKFEGVVHLVLIISHHQLGSLYINKNNYVLLTLPVTLSYSTCYTLPFLLWQLGKHVFLFSNMPPGSFIGPLLHKADMQQTVTALSEGSDLVIASCRPRHRWVFFPFLRHRLKACSITLLHGAHRRRTDRSILSILGSCFPLVSSIVFE